MLIIKLLEPLIDPLSIVLFVEKKTWIEILYYLMWQKNTKMIWQFVQYALCNLGLILITKHIYMGISKKDINLTMIQQL